MMKAIIRLTLVGVVFLGAALSLYAASKAIPATRPVSGVADKKSQKVLSEMETENKKIKSLRCKIHWEVKSKWTSRPGIKKMELAVLKVPMDDKKNPGRMIPLMRLSQKEPFVVEIYVRRKDAVKYEPANKFAQKISINWAKTNKSSQQAFEILLSPANITKSFNVTYEKFESLVPSANISKRAWKTYDKSELHTAQECDVLRVVPASDRVRSDYKSLLIWVSKKTRLPVFMKGEKLDGVTTDKITFMAVKPNARVREKEFEFNPPRDVVIENVDKIELWR